MGVFDSDLKWRRTIYYVLIGMIIGTGLLEVLISVLLILQGLVMSSLLLYTFQYILGPVALYSVTLSVYHLIDRFSKKLSNYARNVLLIVVMTAILLEIAWIHYTFAVTLFVFCLPIILSVFFKDESLAKFSCVLSIICVFICSIHTRVVLKKQGVTDLYQAGNSIIVIVNCVILGFLAVVLVRQQKEMNQKLLDSAKEAEIANEAKTAFLANMSHEIRTPINAVIGMNEMIQRENPSQQIMDYSKDIKGAADTLLNIVNSILDLTKIESGKMELTYAEYDICKIVYDVASIVAIRAQDKGLELIIDISPDIPTSYYGDDVHIKQIITNLLTNAIKYTDKGSVTLKIFGYQEESKEILEVLVKDTGIGIKNEDRAKLFSKFERIDLSRNRNIEGTGLGLIICNQLLKMMNSALKVDSVYGEGSVFSFRLPQKIVDATPCGGFKKSSNIVEEKKDVAYRPKFLAPKAHILVVDDNNMNLKVFANLLKATKIQIDLAHSGREALEKSSLQKYDLIFLDHMMPEMDGIEALLRIRQRDNSKNKETKAIALTANAVVGAREMYLSKGFDSFVSKPIDPADLERTILEFLPEEYIEG